MSGTVIIINAPPIADASVGEPYIISRGYGVSPNSITLNGSASYDPDGYVILYKWYVDDTFLIETENPQISVSYDDIRDITESNGIFDLTLVVIDNYESPSDPYTTDINLQNTLPFVNTNGPYIIPENESRLIHSTGSYDPDGSIVSYEWRLDGDFLSDEPSFTLSHDDAVQMTGGIGQYPLTLKCVDNDGGENTEETTVSLLLPPVADPGGPYGDVSFGDSILLDGSGSTVDDDRTIEYYHWYISTPDGDHLIVTTQDPTISIIYDETLLGITDNIGETYIYLIVEDNYGILSDPISTTIILGVAPSSGGMIILGRSDSQPSSRYYMGSGVIISGVSEVTTDWYTEIDTDVEIHNHPGSIIGFNPHFRKNSGILTQNGIYMMIGNKIILIHQGFRNISDDFVLSRFYNKS